MVVRAQGLCITAIPTRVPVASGKRHSSSKQLVDAGLNCKFSQCHLPSFCHHPDRRHIAEAERPWNVCFTTTSADWESFCLHVVFIERHIKRAADLRDTINFASFLFLYLARERPRKREKLLKLNLGKHLGIVNDCLLSLIAVSRTRRCAFHRRKSRNKGPFSSAGTTPPATRQCERKTQSGHLPLLLWTLAAAPSSRLESICCNLYHYNK